MQICVHLYANLVTQSSTIYLFLRIYQNPMGNPFLLHSRISARVVALSHKVGRDFCSVGKLYRGLFILLYPKISALFWIDCAIYSGYFKEKVPKTLKNRIDACFRSMLVALPMYTNELNLKINNTSSPPPPEKNIQYTTV